MNDIENLKKKLLSRKTYDVKFIERSSGIISEVVLNAFNKTDLRKNEWKSFKHWDIINIKPHK